MVENISAQIAGGSDVTSSRKDNPERILDAAKQFEALLLSQILKASHDADSAGWLDTGDDQTSASVMEMAEEQLAQVLAHSGGIGLASMAVAGLQKPR